MHLWKMVVAAALAAGLFGCATAAPNTPSGRPEVTLKATPPAAVKSFIADAMINRGYSLFRDSDVQITFDKTGTSLGAIMLSTGWGGAPHLRVSYSLLQQGPTLRVVADMALIQNAGSGFERPLAGIPRPPMAVEDVDAVLASTRERFGS